MINSTVITVVQMLSRIGDLSGNLARARTYVEQAATAGSKLVVLPELFDTGYVLGRDLAALIDSDRHSRVREMSMWAESLDLTVVSAIAIRGEDEKIRDEGVVLTPDGGQVFLPKGFLWDAEKETFTPGEPIRTNVIPTPAGRLGVVICYEVGFPEVARSLALEGAELLVVPAAFGAARRTVWNLFARARALENGVYLAAANLSGQGGGRSFAGSTQIVDPRGVPMASLAQEEGLLSVAIDSKEMRSARDEIPYLHDLLEYRRTAQGKGKIE